MFPLPFSVFCTAPPESKWCLTWSFQSLQWFQRGVQMACGSAFGAFLAFPLLIEKNGTCEGVMALSGTQTLLLLH